METNLPAIARPSRPQLYSGYVAMDMLLLLKLMNTLGQLRKHERWTRSQLEAYQVKAFRRQRDYAYVHSPFYQHFHKGLTGRPLQELPVLTKAMVMENFDELVTDQAVRLEDLRAARTSGLECR